MGENGFWGKFVQTQGTLHFSGSRLLPPHLCFENFYPFYYAGLVTLPKKPHPGCGATSLHHIQKIKENKFKKRNRTKHTEWEGGNSPPGHFFQRKAEAFPKYTIFSSTSRLRFVFISRENLWASYAEVKSQGKHASPVSHSEHIHSASPAIKYCPQAGFTKSLTHKSRGNTDAIKLRKILVQPGCCLFFFFYWMDDTLKK